MAKAKSKAVAKGDAEDSNVPAHLRGTGVDQKGFGKDDLVLPMVKLIQGLSSEVEEMDASPGTFWNTGRDVEMGKDFEFIPVTFNKRFLLMAPMFDGRGVLARASDGERWDSAGEWDVKIDKKTEATWTIPTDSKGRPVTVEESGLHRFGTSDPEDANSPPAATMVYEYLVLPVGEDVPVVCFFARTAIKKVKKNLNSKIAIAQSKQIAMQGLVFKARVVDDQNSQGQTFYNWGFQQVRYADEEEYDRASRMLEQFKEYKYDEDRAMSAERTADGEGGSAGKDEVAF